MIVGSRKIACIPQAICGFILVVSIVGCAFVEVTKEAENVAVFQSVEEAAACEKRHEIGTRTQPTVGFIDRDATTIALELERLARNDAARLGANALAPLEAVTSEGTRRYAAFVCPE